MSAALSGHVRLYLFFSFEKRCEPLFARLEVVRTQPSAKQFVAKPDAIGVDDVGLAVPRLERVVVVGE
jgi:hypothetical protein